VTEKSVLIGHKHDDYISKKALKRLHSLRIPAKVGVKGGET